MTARLVQVTNVSTSVTKEQLKSLFTHLGRIEDIQLYPESETLTQAYNAKVGYIRFANSETAQAALNLTNTVFLDRPVLCSIVQYPHRSSSSTSHRIPDEQEALKFCQPFNPNISMIANGITWPHNIVNRIVNSQATSTTKPASYIETIDPILIERSMPSYPNLPGNTDQARAEEIRRTVYVSELDPRVTLLNLYDLFSQVGEIRYIKMTKNSMNDIEYENLGLTNLAGPADFDCSTDSVGAYIEFSEQPSVIRALCLNGLNFAQRNIKVNHSTVTISVPSSSKDIIQIDDLRKELASIDKQRQSSSRNHHSSSSSHRRHEEASRRRSASRSRSQKTSHSRSQQSVSKHSSSKRSERKRDGSNGSTPTTQSDDEIPVQEEEQQQNGNQLIQSGDENTSTTSSKPSPPPRKQARRSRSESKSKRTSSRSRHHHKSPSKSSSTKHSKRSKSRKRDKKDKEKDREKEDRTSKHHHHHHKKSSSRIKDVTPPSKTSKKEKTSNGDETRRKRSHSKSRKRSKSRDVEKSSRKRSKSKEKRKETEKKSRSEHRRSKSKERTSSRHHHRHKSNSTKDDKTKKESSHKSSESKTKSNEKSIVKPRDYDEEEREAMDVTDNETLEQTVKKLNGNSNGNIKESSDGEESDGSNSTSSTKSNAGSVKNGENELRCLSEDDDEKANNNDVNMLEK